MIKCISGYNHSGIRNKLVNSEAMLTQCPRCINKEDQEYVLLCVANEDCNDEFIYQLKKKAIQVEGTKEIIYKVLQFINDIKTYLQQGDFFITNQYRIGYKYLFRWFIVHDQYCENENCYQYILQNELIVKEYIKYYMDC